MKLFVPAVGYRIRLTEKWEFQLYYESRNRALINLVDLDVKPEDYSWQAKAKHFTANLPAGTLLEVDRVYVRTASKTATSPENDYDSMTFKIIDHPHLGNKKKIRFWAKLCDVNTIEYELPENYTASKVQAAEKAKVVKFTTEKIKKELRELSWSAHRTGKLPKWATKTLIAQCEAVNAERSRLHDPWWNAINEARHIEQLKSLEAQLFSGTLSLPLSLAGKIKTMKDLEKSGQYSNYFRRKTLSPRPDTWSDALYKFSHASYGIAKDSDGSKWRTFGADKVRYSHQDEATEPLYNHIWLKVKTSADDGEILEVQAGFNKAIDEKS